MGDTRTDRGDSEQTASIPLGDCFDVLSDRRRRRAVAVVRRAPAPVTIADLAERIAARECADRGSVRCSLYHVHLPRLEDAGVVDVDGDQVRPGATIDAVVERWATVVERAEIPTEVPCPS